MIAASVLGAIFSDERGRHDGGPSWGFFVLILMIGGLFFVWRTVRHTAAPIAEVMSAADRVADGDYAVRVETRANGEVGRLVESFNAMTSRLEVNETQRRNLFADVAHELRTPLSIIRGNTEGMLDGVYPRDDAHLGTILDATAVMSRLLDDLRTLSLTDTGALRLHKQTTDVAELLDDVRYAFTPRAAEAGVTFTLTSVPLPPLDIDPVRVRQVLENLLDNALRHTPRGGTIRIEVGTGRTGGALPGGRHRPRHPRRGAAARLRPLLEIGRLRGQRSGSGHRARSRRGPRRQDPRRQRRGPGDGGVVHAAGGASREEVVSRESQS